MAFVFDAAERAGTELLEKLNPFEEGRKESADVASSLLLEGAEAIPGIGPIIKKGDELLTSAEQKVGSVIREDIVEPIEEKLGFKPDDSDKVTALSKKLDTIKKMPGKKPQKFNFELDDEGKLKLPKKLSKTGGSHRFLFSKILENPENLFTNEEQTKLLESFKDSDIQAMTKTDPELEEKLTKVLLKQPELADVVQPIITSLEDERLEQLENLPGSEIGFAPEVEGEIQPDVRKAEIERILKNNLGVEGKTLLGMEKAGINIPRVFATIDDIKTTQGIDLPKAEIKNIFDYAVNQSEKGIPMDVIEQRLKEIYTGLEKDASGEIMTPKKIRDILNPELPGVTGVLTDSELKSGGILRTMDSESEVLPIREDIDQSIFDEQPGDFVPSGTREPFILDLPEESSSEAEQNFLMKATDKIKSGSIAEGFEDIKGSDFYKGTLSFLRSDLIKGALVAGGVSATGIAIYDKLLEEDNQNDLNLIPKDLEGLNATLKKYGEIYALSQKIGKSKQQALNRFNQPGFDTVRRRDNERELKKLEQDDKKIKANLTEMNRKVENTVRVLKNRDAENDRDIRREKAIKMAKENSDKRQSERQLKNLQRRIIQPVIAKDVAPKIPISINIKNSPKNTSENKFDPRMIQTQM